MSITRKATFGAETGSVARLDLFSTGANPPTIAPIAKTGQRSYQHEGSAFGRTFTAGAIRSCCAIRHGSVQTLGRLPIVTVSVGYTPLTVLWVPAAGELRLMAGFEEDSIAYRYPIAAASDEFFAQAPTAWKIAGIAAKIAASGGYVSFYLEGRKLLTWAGDTRIFAPETTTPLSTINGVYWFGDEGNVIFTGTYTPTGVWGDGTLVDDLTIDALTDADAVDARPPYYALLWTTAAQDGATVEWTKVGADTNAAAVGESSPDGDASYVATATDGKVDQYIPAPLDLAGYRPEFVTVIATGKRASLEAADNQVSLGVWVDGTPDLAAPQYLPADWGEIEATFAAQPDDSPWDAEGIAALRIGLQSVIA